MSHKVDTKPSPAHAVFYVCVQHVGVCVRVCTCGCMNRCSLVTPLVTSWPLHTWLRNQILWIYHGARAERTTVHKVLVNYVYTVRGRGSCSGFRWTVLPDLTLFALYLMYRMSTVTDCITSYFWWCISFVYLHSNVHRGISCLILCLWFSFLPFLTCKARIILTIIITIVIVVVVFVVVICKGITQRHFCVI